MVNSSLKDHFTLSYSQDNKTLSAALKSGLTVTATQGHEVNRMYEYKNIYLSLGVVQYLLTHCPGSSCIPKLSKKENSIFFTYHGGAPKILAHLMHLPIPENHFYSYAGSKTNQAKTQCNSFVWFVHDLIHAFEDYTLSGSQIEIKQGAKSTNEKEIRVTQQAISLLEEIITIPEGDKSQLNELLKTNVF